MILVLKRLAILPALAVGALGLAVVHAGAADRPEPDLVPEFVANIVVDGETLAAFKKVKAEVRVPPVYPLSSKRDGEQGEVTVAAVVNVEGRVEGVFVMEAKASKGMQQAAMTCMRKWRYRPMEKDGRIIRFVAIQPIVFTISR